MTNRFFLPILGSLLLSSHNVIAQVKQSEDKLFEKAFGSKQKEKRIKIPILIDKVSLGEVSFYILGKRITGIDTKELKEALLSKIEPSKIDTIFKDNKNSRVALADLPDDFKITLHLESLYVSLSLPPYYYENKRLISESYPDIAGKQIFTPVDYSHILNYWYDASIFEGQSAKHSLDLSSALNLKGYVLENDFNVTNIDSNTTITRKSTTLVKDFEESEARLQVGDFNFTTMNLQSQMTLLGFNYSKDYSLNPYKKIKPINQFEFILEHKSYVTIYVNDRPVRSEILEKGKHSIEDLVLDFGRNNIKISVKDFSGEQKEFKYSWAGSNELLRSGLSLYSHSFGVRSFYNDLKISYDQASDLVYSGFYQYGISDTLTTGLFSQIDKDQKLLGTSAFNSTSLGNLRFEVAALDDKPSERMGMTTNFEIENSFNSRVGDIRLVLAHQYKSPFYTPFNTVASENLFLHTFRFDTSWYINSYINYSLGFDQEIARKPELEDRITMSASVGLRPFRNGSLNFTYQNRKSETSEVSHLFNIFFNYSYDEKNLFLTTFHDIENKSNQVSLNHIPDKKQDSFYYRTRFDENQTSNKAEFSAGYKSRYFESEISGSSNQGKADYYNARLRGAIVSTLSNTTFSPPVYDSFSVIKGINSLEEKKIGLLNDVGGIGKKEFKNKLFIPQLSSYHYYPIYMDPTHLDIGNSYDYENFYIYPKYKSVVEVGLGNVKSFTVFGKFKDSKLSLKVGELVRDDGFTVSIFTNRSSKFVAQGLLPGKYEIFIENKRTNKYFNIKDDEQTKKLVVIQLGEL